MHLSTLWLLDLKFLNAFAAMGLELQIRRTRHKHRKCGAGHNVAQEKLWQQHWPPLALREHYCRLTSFDQSVCAQRNLTDS
jgi:hypothetical protein